MINLAKKSKKVLDRVFVCFYFFITHTNLHLFYGVKANPNPGGFAKITMQLPSRVKRYDSVNTHYKRKKPL